MEVDRQRVGVIGLGRIGGPVARALVAAGHEVMVYDVRTDAATAILGAEIGSSPVAVGEFADVVMIAVFDDDQVRDVLSGPDGVFGAQSLPGIVCILSTMTLGTLHALVAEGAAVGVGVLDCGVTGGGRLRAEGKIVVLAGGDESAFELAKAALNAFADPLLYMGASGAGMKAKLIRNLMHYSAWYASWEGARLAVEAGVDVAKLVQAHRMANTSGGGTSLLEAGIGPGVESDDAANVERRRYSADVARKDLGYAISLARELGVPTPGAELARDCIDDVVGLASLDRPSVAST
jgi:3-hydroxyisobutyrate dehydrogenase-like beta-hydroxyacid dehydrogenase